MVLRITVQIESPFQGLQSAPQLLLLMDVKCKMTDLNIGVLWKLICIVKIPLKVMHITSFVNQYDGLGSRTVVATHRQICRRRSYPSGQWWDKD